MIKPSDQLSLENPAGSQIEQVQIRVHDGRRDATLIYLPGVHGDWTLVGGFRCALHEAVRFVEISYPRTTTWSLSDYASSIVAALGEHGVSRGWLLGESFGSQVVWEIVKQRGFHVEGVILAGGFARHPAPWMARLAAGLAGKISFRLVRAGLFGYARVSRFRFRRSPETLANIHEFAARRTEVDCRAIKHRLELVANNDPREIVREVSKRVYALTGLFDPIVPWYPARRWFQRNCPRLCGHRTIWRADHNVLGTAPAAAAAQVLEWMANPPREFSSRPA